MFHNIFLLDTMKVNAYNVLTRKIVLNFRHRHSEVVGAPVEIWLQPIHIALAYLVPNSLFLVLN